MGGPLIAWLAAAAVAATCDLSGPADAGFAVPLEADRVRVVVELWAEGADPAWAHALLDALDARGLGAVVVVPPDDVDEALLARVAAGPHEAAIVLDERDVPRDVLQRLGDLKRQLKPVRKAAGGATVVLAPIGSRASEAMLGRAGFRALVNVQGPPTAQARMAGHLEGQPRINVVLHAGPYEDACGTDPRVGPFTPVAADRAAQAIQRANRSPGVPIVRVSLVGARGASTDAQVLGRWIDEVLVAGGVSVVTASAARLEALQSFRRGEEPPPAEAAGGGRVVAHAQAVQAAEALRDVVVLPRSLPGELSPTEAFYAFCLVASGRSEGSAVRIGALLGPPTLAESTLGGEVALDPERVRGVARSLLAAMPSEVPAALPVDGHLLTASELLLALASVVRGDEAPTTRPVAVPEPNERGLGWGAATLP